MVSRQLPLEYCPKLLPQDICPQIISPQSIAQNIIDPFEKKQTKAKFDLFKKL